jgi:hypothetical protein
MTVSAARPVAARADHLQAVVHHRSSVDRAGGTGGRHVRWRAICYSRADPGEHLRRKRRSRAPGVSGLSSYGDRSSRPSTPSAPRCRNHRCGRCSSCHRGLFIVRQRQEASRTQARVSLVLELVHHTNPLIRRCWVLAGHIAGNLLAALSRSAPLPHRLVLLFPGARQAVDSDRRTSRDDLSRVKPVHHQSTDGPDWRSSAPPPRM